MATKIVSISRARRGHGRKKNADLRPREYLTPVEVEALIEAAGQVGRHPLRDQTLLLLMHRRALRVSEAIGLSWDQVDLEEGWIHLPRLKGGVTTAQPLSAAEQQALLVLRGRYPASQFLFPSERGARLSRGAVNRIISRAGQSAGLSIKVHPHMLRHGCGYALVNRGEDLRKIQMLMGHARIESTIQYTMLDQSRLKGIWD